MEQTTMWQDQLLAFAKKHDHPAWGVAHSERIYRLSLSLAEGQGPIDREALYAAAYLHDVGAFVAFRREGADHAERSCDLMPEICSSVSFPAEKVALVQEIARGHMYSSRPAPRVEAVAFHDADTLDFLGAIGIARLLAIVGLSDWTPDLPSAIARIQRFTRELPSYLYTAQARVLAAERQYETEAFLRALADETRNLEIL
jgi:uncharacterized protein